MTIELTWGTVAAMSTVFGALSGVAGKLVGAALEKRDDKIAELCEDIDANAKTHASDVASLKATQKLLFDKLDKLTEDFNGYKLHVAETYVAEAKLEKLLLPIERRLEAIEKDLRGANKS